MNSLSVQKIRTRMYAIIRGFFQDLGYLEVETPSLSPSIIPEVHIDVFASEYRSWTSQLPLYLLPSPEYYMKQLLSQASGSIFQISRCFRNAEVLTPIHSIEFSMLEWYSIDCDYMDNLLLQERLLHRLASDTELQQLITEHNGSRELTDRLLENIRQPIEKINMQKAFTTYADMDLEAALLRQEIHDDDFHRILVDRIEPQLPQDRPVALIDYPSLVPTTGKQKAGGPWTERWELYIGGIEIANCYTEAPACELTNYFVAELAEMAVSGREKQSDSSFPERISSMPQCSGNALGLDRLLMQLCGEPSIKGVILFPLHDSIRS